MKNQIVVLILISSLFLFLSCKRSVFEEKITQENSFWYIFEYDSLSKHYKNVNYGYKFYSNGKCKYMLYDISTNQINEYYNIMQDVIVSNEWKFIKKDSTFEVNSWQYKMTYSNKDTIILEFLDSNKKQIFINLGNKNPKYFSTYKLKN